MGLFIGVGLVAAMPGGAVDSGRGGGRPRFLYDREKNAGEWLLPGDHAVAGGKGGGKIHLEAGVDEEVGVRACPEMIADGFGGMELGDRVGGVEDDARRNAPESGPRARGGPGAEGVDEASGRAGPADDIASHRRQERDHEAGADRQGAEGRLPPSLGLEDPGRSGRRHRDQADRGEDGKLGNPCTGGERQGDPEPESGEEQNRPGQPHHPFEGSVRETAPPGADCFAGAPRGEEIPGDDGQRRIGGPDVAGQLCPCGRKHPQPRRQPAEHQPHRIPARGGVRPGGRRRGGADEDGRVDQRGGEHDRPGEEADGEHGGVVGEGRTVMPLHRSLEAPDIVDEKEAVQPSAAGADGDGGVPGEGDGRRGCRDQREAEAHDGPPQSGDPGTGGSLVIPGLPEREDREGQKWDGQTDGAFGEHGSAEGGATAHGPAPRRPSGPEFASRPTVSHDEAPQAERREEDEGGVGGCGPPPHRRPDTRGHGEPGDEARRGAAAVPGDLPNDQTGDGREDGRAEAGPGLGAPGQGKAGQVEPIDEGRLLNPEAAIEGRDDPIPPLEHGQRAGCVLRFVLVPQRRPPQIREEHQRRGNGNDDGVQTRRDHGGAPSRGGGTNATARSGGRAGRGQ